MRGSVTMQGAQILPSNGFIWLLGEEYKLDAGENHVQTNEKVLQTGLIRTSLLEVALSVDCVSDAIINPVSQGF